jgi:hypothetical protein
LVRPLLRIWLLRVPVRRVWLLLVRLLRVSLGLLGMLPRRQATGALTLLRALTLLSVTRSLLFVVAHPCVPSSRPNPLYNK